MKKKIFILMFSLLLPVFITFAAPPDVDTSALNQCKNIRLTSISNILNWASCTLVSSVVPLLFGIAMVAFIWGIIQYFLNPDNEEKRKKGKSYMLWGLIALFVMVSMWGLVGILTKTFEIQTLIPQLSQ